MNKTTCAVSKDASGRRYIDQTNGESEKNHGINDGSFETSGRRIYETNGGKCSVKSFLKYVSLLHPDFGIFVATPKRKSQHL